MTSYRFDCSSCPIKCDGKSLGVYNFLNDVEYSERYEKKLIEGIKKLGFFAQKTEKAQYPDIEVYDKKSGNLLCFIEVKAQRRTFMSVQKYLPDSHLTPSETVALNQSDLEHYIQQKKIENVPIFIMWVLSNRPCITGDNKTLFFYNKLEELEHIFNTYQHKRRFRRKSGVGDVVNGEHKGVVVNYHFSLAELLPFSFQAWRNELVKQ